MFNYEDEYAGHSRSLRNVSSAEEHTLVLSLLTNKPAATVSLFGVTVTEQ